MRQSALQTNSSRPCEPAVHRELLYVAPDIHHDSLVLEVHEGGIRQQQLVGQASEGQKT